MMSIVRFRFAVLASLAMLLSACQLMPGQTGNQRPIGADVLPAFGTKNIPAQPEMLTFPSLVTPQTFATLNKPDARGKFWWVKFAVAKEVYPQPALTEISGDDEDDDQGERAEERSEDADHDDKPASHRIWIPENGAFKVNLVGGSRYQLLDNDARDGEATVQLPSEQLAMYLQAQGPKSREGKKNKPAIERKLTLAESLYYVNQTISRLGPEGDGKGRGDKDSKKQAWLKLGQRPFPLPTSWHSPDGQKYVLNFTNQGVQRLVARWYRAQAGAQPDYPVGMKEMGPEGGKLELPNVAKFDIPAGALTQKTVIRMSQALSARSREFICPHADRPDYCYPNRVYVSPIVQLQPIGLELKQPANMDLRLFQEAYNHAPYDIGPLGNLDLNTDHWSYEFYLALDPNIHSIRDLTYDLHIPIKIFAYISKQASGSRKLSKEAAFRYPPDDSFRIHSLPDAQDRV